MRKIKQANYIYSIFLLALIFSTFTAKGESTREERRLINEGNKLYTERKFADAAKKYEEALGVNSQSAVGKYNLGLAQLKQVTNPQDSTPKSQSLLSSARQNLSSVAALAKDKPGLASKANYNLGNLEFNTKEYKNAVDYYKQALRINPNDESARKNLRIAQKQLQNQDQDKNQNQDQNKEQQDQQDQQKDQNQNQDQNQDQNKNQNQDQKQNQDKQQEQQINPQTANQILQAMDNKENQTRARVNRANKGEKAKGSGGMRKKW